MLRHVWQKLMIALARSSLVTRLMQSWRSSTALARRYLGGANSEDACHTAARLASRGIRASLFFMGEYIEDEKQVATSVNEKISIASMLADADLDIHVSVDPTQIGYTISRDLGRDNAFRIARHIDSISRGKQGVHCLMLDMEDISLVEPTIELHDELFTNNYPVGLTLQAHLKRTKHDLRREQKRSAKVRLVKGAFREHNSIAFVKHSDIKANYLSLAKMMLSPEARANAFYPIFATHDDRFQQELISFARQCGWAMDEYEFEMLYGARPDVARMLADAGTRIREYVAYGTEWWPYAVRRIGENPKGGVQLIRAALGF